MKLAIGYSNEAPSRSSSNYGGSKASRKLGQGKSRSTTLIAIAASPLVIAASKPRNPIAADALLKKSGPHDDKRRAQKIRAQEQLKIGWDEIRRREIDD